MERPVTHLPGNLRLLALALVVLSVATMLTLALALAVGRDYSGPDFAIVRTALSVVIITGAGLGVATVAATCVLDDPDTVTKRRHRLGILTDGLLTGAALTEPHNVEQEEGDHQARRERRRVLGEARVE